MIIDTIRYVIRNYVKHTIIRKLSIKKDTTKINTNKITNKPMRTLNIPLEETEYIKLTINKGELSWHDYIMKLAQEEDEKQ